MNLFQIQPRLSCGTEGAGYLDNRVEQNYAGLFSDDLLRGEMMLDELRNGGEARSLEAVLTLRRGTGVNRNSSTSKR